MSRPAAFLMTETELTLLAAVGGMGGLLSFQPTRLPERAEQVEAVYHLLRRGALVQNGAQVGLSGELVPVFDCMRKALAVTLLTPRDFDAPQMCLYCAGREVAYVMPHETKRGNLRLGLTAADGLPELLEELGLLPASFMANNTVLAPLREEDVPTLVLPSDADGRVRDREVLDEAILTVLERFSLSDGMVRERAAVFRTPIAWGFAVFSDRLEYRAYTPRDVLSWIRGDHFD